MYGKSIYANKSEIELSNIKYLKRLTFYSKDKCERDIINKRRAKGLPVICINTGEYFKSVSEAARKYPGSSKAYKCSKKEFCYAGMFNGKLLKWRMATDEEIRNNEE